MHRSRVLSTVPDVKRQQADHDESAATAVDPTRPPSGRRATSDHSPSPVDDAATVDLAQVSLELYVTLEELLLGTHPDGLAEASHATERAAAAVGGEGAAIDCNTRVAPTRCGRIPGGEQRIFCRGLYDSASPSSDLRISNPRRVCDL